MCGLTVTEPSPHRQSADSRVGHGAIRDQSKTSPGARRVREGEERGIRPHHHCRKDIHFSSRLTQVSRQSNPGSDKNHKIEFSE
ncbi:hypothetical protein J6590_052493 [Homalodisca vitripennis]|nr:hypothetical protein J6590_052493 [Homalodisca vitripennis]